MNKYKIELECSWKIWKNNCSLKKYEEYEQIASITIIDPTVVCPTDADRYKQYLWSVESDLPSSRRLGFKKREQDQRMIVVETKD